LLSIFLCGKQIMPDRKQLNIRISVELHKQAKVISILNGQTLNDYIETAIKKALEKDKALVQKLKGKNE
jgi:predicted HicB family RNase H-like nuclease